MTLFLCFQRLKIPACAVIFRSGIGDVGKGTSLSFWWENWTHYGTLTKAVGPSGSRALRLLLFTTISSACNVEGWWLLPNPRSDEAFRLHIHLTTIPNPGLSFAEDSFAWIVDGTDCRGFS